MKPKSEHPSLVLLSTLIHEELEGGQSQLANALKRSNPKVVRLMSEEAWGEWILNPSSFNR